MTTYKSYTDHGDTGGPVVVLVHAPKRPTRRLRHLIVHSPTGFNVGYCGSGPSDLALALLADHLGEAASIPAHNRYSPAVAAQIEETAAWHLHHLFTRQVVSLFPQGRSFTLQAAAIDAWLIPHRAEVERLQAQRGLRALIGQRVTLRDGMVAQVTDLGDETGTLVVYLTRTSAWRMIGPHEVVRLLGQHPEDGLSPRS